MAVRDRGLAELALFAALATLHTWPLASDPAHFTRLDNDDTALNTWIVAWVIRRIGRDPLHLFDAPIFHPAPDALAYSEHLLVPSLMGAPLAALGASPVLVYNALVWLGLTLSGFAMSRLIRGWTGSLAAGLVSGCLYAFNAHLLTRYPHLQALHVEFLPVALYGFDRLLRAPGARSGALLGAGFVLQALCSNYMMVMMTAALGVSLLVRREPWRRSARPFWIALALTAGLALLVLLPFLLPYYRVHTEQGLARSLDEVRLYSAGWLDYLATGGRLHHALWSHQVFEGRTALFPGITALALALGAAALGIVWRDPRARMAAAFGALGFALSFGPSLPGYAWLHEHVALLQGFRGAARWGLLTLIAIAVLAGFAVATLERLWRSRWWWPAAALALLGAVNLEALRAPLPMVRYDGTAAIHDRLRSPDVRAVVVFPLYAGAQVSRNASYMLDQTRHWQPMVNGYSGWTPAAFEAHAGTLRTFPDEASISLLRALGVTHVIVHRDAFLAGRGPDTLAALRSHAELRLTAEADGVWLMRILE